jgi:hypothetical protein
MTNSPVKVTKYINGVAQTTIVVNESAKGFILCDMYKKTVRSSLSLSTIAAAWFDKGGDGGGYQLSCADGSSLSQSQIFKVRNIMEEMQ